MLKAAAASSRVYAPFVLFLAIIIMFFSFSLAIGFFLFLSTTVRLVLSFAPVVVTTPSQRQQVMHTTTTSTTTTTTALSVLERHHEDSAEYATPLELSTVDWQRLTRARRVRRQEMPLLILPEALLPRQGLVLESTDPAVCRLVDYCLTHDAALCLLGVNPLSGRPLGRGVTVNVTAAAREHALYANPVSGSVRLAVTAASARDDDGLVEVQGEPWLVDDDDGRGGSFYMADVETVPYGDGSSSSSVHEMTPQQREGALYLSDTLPSLMDEWRKWVIKSGACDHDGLQERLEALIGGENGDDDDHDGQHYSDYGMMPTGLTERAFLVAAMLNPSRPKAYRHPVCIDIRPAMLACTNDYERTILAVQALQSSMDHLSGKHKLF